ncbi:hypothetical protein [Kineococcus sp. SYSU DK001]|uniref:hypothetical protein n=1 Tax=Kineococcus sp. SYSU DK001 TaxID=3383122 RepID=UPI003D7CD6DE
MRAPDLETLRPGDFVKVRGNANPLHNGGRAVVVAVHRAPGPPWRVVALDLRYSARGAAVRVELADSGELARWETPWAPTQTVEDEPARHHPVTSPGVAHVETPRSRRRLLIAVAAVLAVVGGLATWEQQRTEPNPVVVQRALLEGVRGSGTGATAGPSSTSTPTATAAQVAATASVVAYSTGPVPVVETPEGARTPTPLAGVEPAPGCRDGYVADLLSYLPLGQLVEVTGAGWFRTDDGLDVNAELVRQGVAVPVETTAGSSPADVRNLAALRELAADAPSC